MNNLPLTNKHLFMRTANGYDYEYYANKKNKERFYYQFYSETTKHYTLRINFGVHLNEGIIIHWHGNPFKLKI